MSFNKGLRSYVSLNPEDVSQSVSLCIEEHKIVLSPKRSELVTVWTKGKSIQVSAEFRIEKITDYYIELEKINKTQLSLVLTWYSPSSSGGTSLRGLIAEEEIRCEPTNAAYSLKGSINGELISGKIILAAQIIVSDPGIDSGIELGVELWSEQFDLILEGEKSQFPTKIVPFSKSMGALPKNSLFHLSRDIEEINLEESFSNIYTLLLNEENEITQILNRTSESDIASRGILNLLLLDVYREIIFDISKNSESIQDLYSSNSSIESGTVGAVYLSILSSIFPEIKNRRDIQESLNIVKNDISRLDFLLQEAVFL